MSRLDPFSPFRDPQGSTNIAKCDYPDVGYWFFYNDIQSIWQIMSSGLGAKQGWRLVGKSKNCLDNLTNFTYDSNP
jgi:hypothetical protein